MSGKRPMPETLGQVPCDNAFASSAHEKGLRAITDFLGLDEIDDMRLEELEGLFQNIDFLTPLEDGSLLLPDETACGGPEFIEQEFHEDGVGCKQYASIRIPAHGGEQTLSEAKECSTREWGCEHHLAIRIPAPGLEPGTS